MTNEERIAVLESQLKRNERDITKLFDFVREHMEREEQHMIKAEADRLESMKQLNDIRATINKQKSFVGGVIFTITSMWAILSALAYWFFQTKGH